jgi:hypothetical protein
VRDGSGPEVTILKPELAGFPDEFAQGVNKSGTVVGALDRSSGPVFGVSR